MNKNKSKELYYKYNVKKVTPAKYRYDDNYNKKKFLILFIIVIFLIIFVKNINNNEKVEEKNDIEYLHTVCIDPGHGGYDSGATNKKRMEKDDNLKVAMQVKNNLEKNGIKVILTREEDKYVSLEERTNLANSNKCELFVSIHRNSSETGNGIEIWIMNNQKDAKELADSIMNEFANLKNENLRGVKEGTEGEEKTNYFVNKKTSMPSCIIELGFITSNDDNKLFDKNVNKYAEYISQGIINMFIEK